MENVTKELAEYLHAIGDAHLIPIRDGVEAVSLPTHRRLQSIKPLLDEYLTAPERKKGTATVTDLNSFIALTARGMDASSALYAKRDPAKPHLLAALNYNVPEEAGGAARYGDHRVYYPFPVSTEWAAWQAKNASKMGQADFAEFLEDRIADVMEPPTGVVVDGGGQDAITDLAKLLGGVFAGPSRLLELSRGMSVSAGHKVKHAVNIGSGEVTIQFEEEHTDDKGKPLKVPSLFVIAIPIFDRGPLYRIGVRLRYRIAAGSIVWFYELYRADKSFDHAFEEACVTARDATGLSLFYGSPEV